MSRNAKSKLFFNHIIQEKERDCQADEMTQELGATMFDTKDFQNGVASFLKEGPGKVTFKGI